MNPLLIHKHIDLVDFGDVKCFMFRGDNLYRLAVANDKKNKSLAEHNIEVRQRGYRPAPVTPENIDTIDRCRYCLHIVVGNLLRSLGEITVLDIGAFVGDFAIRMGNLIRTFGRQDRVYAFDPTDAGALIPYNMRINGLEGIVIHEELAIDCHAQYSLFTVSPGDYDSTTAAKSQAPRFNLWAQFQFLLKTNHKFAYIEKLIRHFRPKPHYNIIVEATTISDFAARIGLNTPIFAKIDVEGLDSDVVRDLRSLSKARGVPVTIVFEFKPRSYGTLEEAAAFLTDLTDEYYVFDVWYCPNPCLCNEVTREGVHNFVNTVQNQRIMAYTDVLLLPKSLPGSAQLAQRLSKLAPEPPEYILA
jgi:FkbM family methyltransferase